MSDFEGVLSLLNRFSSRYLTLPMVALVSAVIIFGAVFFSFIFFFVTLFSRGLFGMPLCFSSGCVDFWIKENSAVFSVLSAAGAVVTGLVTIGGILIALKSYQSSVKASAITNHLSHLSLFISYVSSEIKRRSRIADSEVESLRWYNLVYAKSISGVLTVSNEYAEFVTRLNCQIERSNSLYASAEGVGYRYKEHQTAMIVIFSDIGIYLERLPRIDFNEVESQVLDLVQTINLSFCRDGKVSKISERNYH
ncbi:retron Ec48 family effector membrane protein [Pseudomonas wayambapalatensis]|nr:retron Ec48 family effector membrane protein [Pseudomonas wayambapalatensis]